MKIVQLESLSRQISICIQCMTELGGEKLTIVRARSETERETERGRDGSVNAGREKV